MEKVVRVRCYNVVRMGGGQVETYCNWVGYRLPSTKKACPWCGTDFLIKEIKRWV